MKVVLLKDIPGVGRKNDIKSVSDGYALNFLIPKKLAAVGTPQTMAHAERQKSEQAAERKIQADLLAKNFKSMEGVTVELVGKASEKGHLFASVHAKDIIAALKEQKGIDLPAEFLELPQAIKSIGEHQIAVKADGKTGSFTLVVRALAS